MKHKWLFAGNTFASSFYICDLCGKFVSASDLMLIGDEGCEAKLAMVPLPPHDMPITDGFTNLNGWWNPPGYVKEFWATGCYIYFGNEADYKYKVEELLELYNKSVRSFYSLMAM